MFSTIMLAGGNCYESIEMHRTKSYEECLVAECCMSDCALLFQGVSSSRELVCQRKVGSFDWDCAHLHCCTC